MKKLQLLLVLLLLISLAGCVSQPADNDGIAVNDNLETIYNFSHPAPNHATGGQPKKHEVAMLADAGVDMIVNLRSHAEMADIHEAEWATHNHLAYYHIPIAGADDLTEENVKLFHQTLWLNEDKNIFMHCASSNRVGALMALRAAWFQGADTAEALAIGERYGMTSLRKRVEELLNE
ncbi:serine/threonine protein phosphatase [Pseudidiomarina sp. 1APP75-27a]|uniref:fused DSP-PTPase phosphatase/NAD kinase-like protein n=1 Tax=Pseudidiomarina terrestris TaxID=2820060 RepID=UPI002B05FBFC|nr:sulfur transferase domain-containing protein [Pseudidiomarina sp. 1APP75-27a]MEA3588036.1 serine/threonine protein phosphatase [Pseudidiomarina sp. 1APP75-27a]